MLRLELMFESIIDYIEEHPNTTMLELCENINGFRGDLQWHLGQNIFIYNNCSQDAIELMIMLLKNNMIYAEIVPPSVYLKEGFVPAYPLAKSHKGRYKYPRWLPLTFSKSPSLIENWDLYPLDLSRSGWSSHCWLVRPFTLKQRLEYTGYNSEIDTIIASKFNKI